MDQEQHTRRVAVVVVLGVGDDTPGSGRDEVVDMLVADPSGRWESADRRDDLRLVASAESRGEAQDGELVSGLGAPNLREPFTVPTATVHGRDGAPDVTVHEMYWADLSRAQGSAQRLFYLLFAITLQVSTLGIEALRGLREPRTRVVGVLQGTLTVLSYFLVYVVTPLLFTIGGMAVTVNLMLLTHVSGAMAAGLWLVCLIAMAAVAWWIADRIFRGGWTFDPPQKPRGFRRGRTPWWGSQWLWWGAAAAVGGAILIVWVLTQRVPGWVPLSIGYLLFIDCGAVGLATLFIRRVSPDEPTDEQLRTARHNVRLVVRFAFAAVPVGAMVCAAAVKSGHAQLSVRVADTLTMVAAGVFRVAWLAMLVGCTVAVLMALALPRVPDRPGDPEGTARRGVIGTVMASVVLGPLLFSLASSSSFLLFNAVWRVYPSFAKSWGDGMQPARPGTTLFHPLGARFDETASTADWGTAVVKSLIQPLGVALLLLLVIAVLLTFTFKGYVRTLGTRYRCASAVNASTEQAGALTTALGRLDGSLAFLGAVIPLVALSTAAAALAWMVPAHAVQVPARWMAQVAFPIAYALALLSIAAVGLGRVGPVGNFGGGFGRLLGTVLDLLYDVSTYLRVGTPAMVVPRVRMMARYRAILAHIAGTAPDRTVVFAHSQGTILSLAALLGDEGRLPKVAKPPAAAVPRPLTLVTYGSPTLQIYARRFPGQFAPWVEEGVAPGSAITEWCNLFRAGDYVGRGLGPHHSADPDAPDTAPIRERCLGPGLHTGYTKDERWRRVARAIVAAPEVPALSSVDLSDLTVARIGGWGDRTA